MRRWLAFLVGLALPIAASAQSVDRIQNFPPPTEVSQTGRYFTELINQLNAGIIAQYNANNPAGKLNRDASNAQLPTALNNIATFQVTGGTTAPALQQRFNHTRNAVDDFGADNTGGHDTAAQFSVAINSPDATRGIFIPCGTYRLDSKVNATVSNALIDGCGPATVIVNNNATTTDDTIEATGALVTFNGLTFNHLIARTAGADLNLTGRSFRVLNSLFNGSFTAVRMDGDDIYLDQLTITDVVHATGKAIVLTGNRAAQVIGYMIVNSHTGITPLACIWLDSAQDLTVGPSECIHTDTGLMAVPGDGQNIQSLKLNGTFFDTSMTRGIDLCPTGTGTIRAGTMVGVWSASFFQVNAMRMCAGVDGLDIVSPQFFAAVSTNLQVDGGINWKILGGQIAGSGTGFGVSVAAGVSNWDILGPSVGALANFPTNFSGGIAVAGGAGDNYSILGVRCYSQTNCTQDGGSGAAHQVHSNIGQSTAQHYASQAGYSWYSALGVQTGGLTDAGFMGANAFFCKPDASPVVASACALGFPQTSTLGPSISLGGTSAALAGAISISTAATAGIEKIRIWNSGGLAIATTPVDPGVNNLYVQGTALIPGLDVTPGGKKIVCVDDATGQFYKANAGAC